MPLSFGRSPWDSVVITQRGQGPVMLNRTAPIASICPIQAFSTKSFSPFAVSTTMFGRNRRTSKRPCGYSPQPIERGRGQQLHKRTVEKSTPRQTAVGDGVPVIEALDIRPVLLSCGRPIGQCGQFHLTLEHLREYLVEVGLLAIDDVAIREGDADRRRLHTGSWNVTQRGATIE